MRHTTLKTCTAAFRRSISDARGSQRGRTNAPMLNVERVSAAGKMRAPARSRSFVKNKHLRGPFGRSSRARQGLIGIATSHDHALSSPLCSSSQPDRFKHTSGPSAGRDTTHRVPCRWDAAPKRQTTFGTLRQHVTPGGEQGGFELHPRHVERLAVARARPPAPMANGFSLREVLFHSTLREALLGGAHNDGCPPRGLLPYKGRRRLLLYALVRPPRVMTSCTNIRRLGPGLHAPGPVWL